MLLKYPLTQSNKQWSSWNKELQRVRFGESAISFPISFLYVTSNKDRMIALIVSPRTHPEKYYMIAYNIKIIT